MNLKVSDKTISFYQIFREHDQLNFWESSLVKFEQGNLIKNEKLAPHT